MTRSQLRNSAGSVMSAECQTAGFQT